ncbi:hypothetical protein RSAG8_12350, partial [Rhizoctonia solani AG-8 WAC10335]
MLHTIAIAYCNFESWPPAGYTSAQDEVPYEMIAKELTLIAITGIEDPLHPGVKEAIAKCHGAGVMIKMCTGDNVLMACLITSQCGIFMAGGIIMEGPVFHCLSPAEQHEIIPHLQVLAHSSPKDKCILIDTLKGLGEIVGVTSDSTNDGPALKHANVSFSMGIARTEIAKEALDIILMDDNFSLIVSTIMWGHCVNDSVCKFLQFQILVNITAILITFISAVSSNEEESMLTAVQLLWINIIMDTFAALALATDPALPESLKHMPDHKNAPLFSVDMGKMIIEPAFGDTILGHIPAASPATTSTPTPTKAHQSVPARRPKMQPPPLQPIPESEVAYNPISSSATVPVPAPLVPVSLASPVTLVESSAMAISRQTTKARTHGGGGGVF